MSRTWPISRTWSDETDNDVMTMHELLAGLAATAETVSTTVDMAESAR